MANISCGACEDLRQEAPGLIVNGFDETMCASLKNDTGLSPSSGNNDCTDLNNLNDCLVGNMATEVESYDVCDWKSFMKQFIPNLWTVLKAMICAICGIWDNIHSIWDKLNCAFDGIVNLITQLNQTTQGQAFVRYYRDNSGTGEGYFWNIRDDESNFLDIYMDADLDNPGSQPADRDYIVMISNCTDIHDASVFGVYLTYFSSGDGRPMATIRKRQAQHPHINLSGATVDVVSWTCSGAVLIRKGEHVRVEGRVYAGNSGEYRLHQFVLTWIPINAGSTPLDPSTIIPC